MKVNSKGKCKTWRGKGRADCLAARGCLFSARSAPQRGVKRWLCAGYKSLLREEVPAPGADKGRVRAQAGSWNEAGHTQTCGSIYIGLWDG